MSPIDVMGQQALARRESPFGAVGVIHEGEDLRAWWIWKHAEAVDPAVSVADRDDLLYVIRGMLRLELAEREPFDVHAGEAFVIPAGTPFRGYSWPRGGQPCQFLAVAPGDTTFVRLPE